MPSARMSDIDDSGYQPDKKFIQLMILFLVRFEH